MCVINPYNTTYNQISRLGYTDTEIQTARTGMSCKSLVKWASAQLFGPI